MDHAAPPEWVAIAARCLQRRWRSIDPEQLDDLAADLWRDERLRVMRPSDAVDAWLAPISSPNAGTPGGGSGR